MQLNGYHDIYTNGKKAAKATKTTRRGGKKKAEAAKAEEAPVAEAPAAEEAPKAE